MPSDLEQTIAKTIAFFDVFSYPVNLSEIRDFLFQPTQSVLLEDIHDALRGSSYLKERIVFERGYYLLRGQESLVVLRNKRYRIAEKKYARALAATKIIARVPFVRLVCVVNSLAMSNASRESDIDLFISARAGHVWAVRFIVTALLHIMGLRPRENRKQDAICASFFVSDESYDLAELSIPHDSATGLHDLYLAWWASRCVPIYDEGGEAKKFFQANSWARSVFPYRREYLTSRLRTVSLGAGARWAKRFAERCLSLFSGSTERVARAIQWKILPQSLRAIVNKDTRVRMTDSILKFHQNDTRDDFRVRFIATCKKYDISL